MSTPTVKATPGWAEDGRVMATAVVWLAMGPTGAAPVGPMMPVPAHW